MKNKRRHDLGEVIYVIISLHLLGYIQQFNDTQTWPPSENTVTRWHVKMCTESQAEYFQSHMVFEKDTELKYIIGSLDHFSWDISSISEQRSMWEEIRARLFSPTRQSACRKVLELLNGNNQLWYKVTCTQCSQQQTK